LRILKRFAGDIYLVDIFWPGIYAWSLIVSSRFEVKRDGATSLSVRIGFLEGRGWIRHWKDPEM
jgi:hypothetical protein